MASSSLGSWRSDSRWELAGGLEVTPVSCPAGPGQARCRALGAGVAVFSQRVAWVSYSPGRCWGCMRKQAGR